MNSMLNWLQRHSHFTTPSQASILNSVAVFDMLKSCKDSHNALTKYPFRGKLSPIAFEWRAKNQTPAWEQIKINKTRVFHFTMAVKFLFVKRLIVYSMRITIYIMIPAISADSLLNTQRICLIRWCNYNLDGSNVRRSALGQPLVLFWTLPPSSEDVFSFWHITKRQSHSLELSALSNESTEISGNKLGMKRGISCFWIFTVYR